MVYIIDSLISRFCIAVKVVKFAHPVGPEPMSANTVNLGRYLLRLDRDKLASTARTSLRSKLRTC